MLVARIAINFLKALKMNMKAMRVANNSSVNLKQGILKRLEKPYIKYDWILETPMAK